MTDLQIRVAEARDIPAIANVVNDWEDSTPWIERMFPRETIEGFVRDSFPDRTIWVVGDPVEAYLSFDEGESRVVALYCDTPGAGNGKALMNKAKDGRDFLWLTTYEPNADARRFYAREGFVEVAVLEAEAPQTLRELRLEWRA